MNINMKPGYIFAGILTLLCLATPEDGTPDIFEVIFIFLILYGIYASLECVFKSISSKYNSNKGGEPDYGSNKKETGD